VVERRDSIWETEESRAVWKEGDRVDVEVMGCSVVEWRGCGLGSREGVKDAAWGVRRVKRKNENFIVAC
jgi:hypothetical protein